MTFSSFGLMVPTPLSSSLNASTVTLPSNSLGIPPYLDVDVHLSHDHLHTSVHLKPTNLQQYLNFSNCHPSSTKCSIPFSLASRGGKSGWFPYLNYHRSHPVILHQRLPNKFPMHFSHIPLGLPNPPMTLTLAWGRFAHPLRIFHYPQFPRKFLYCHFLQTTQLSQTPTSIIVPLPHPENSSPVRHAPFTSPPIIH